MCEGITHTLSGMAGWCLAAAPVAVALDVDVTPAAVLAGAFVAGGAAQLPDTDHPNSAIAHALGPVSRTICRGVSKVFKHRHETHYAVAVPVWALLAAGVARVRLDLLETPARVLAGVWPDLAGVHAFTVEHGHRQLGLFLVVALLAAWGLRLLSSDLDRSLEGAGEIAVGVAVAAAAFLWVPLGGWVPAAVAVGVLSHDLGDLLTKGPFRFLWPLPWRIALGWFLTGHWAERAVVAPLLLVAVTVLLWVKAVGPLADQARLYLAGVLP